KILRNLSAHRLQEFSSKFFGQSLQILWEGKRDKWGRILGKSSEYLRVTATKSLSPSQGEMTRSILKGVSHSGTLLVDQHQSDPLFTS
ncbi:MAG: hypothetical protein OXC40_05730, partial [Proteobacteria bacterium]|nr:hypothetical protein [Pseudomonadota bacterium]